MNKTLADTYLAKYLGSDDLPVPDKPSNISSRELAKPEMNILIESIS